MNTTRGRFGALALAIVLTASPGCAEATPTPPEGFYLEVIFPHRTIAITIPYVVVEGRTSPDATVKVNGEAAEVEASGYFTHGVRPPDEGDNVIVIVARSPDGRELVERRTVTYVEPPGRYIWQ